MRPIDTDPHVFALWEGVVAFRLFADQEDPTLTVSEQIAARLGDRILDGRLQPSDRIDEQALERGNVESLVALTRVRIQESGEEGVRVLQALRKEAS